MESIEKLRNVKCEGQPCSAYRKLADEIEREIAERYMELPVDADGVPIRVGDDLKFVNGELLCCEGVDAHGAIVWREEQFEHIQGDCCRHVKPRTLEDVLWDFACAMEPKYSKYTDAYKPEFLREYAAEIRDLLGGEGE